MTDYESVTSKISLDFAQRTSPVTVFAKQGDENTRHITITPLANGVPMSLGNDEHFVARFAAKKPDGTYVYNDSASIGADGLINVTLTDQTLAAHGNALCCIVLTNNDGKTLTSQNFTLIIEYSAGAYENLASSDEILGIDVKIDEINALMTRIEGMLESGELRGDSIFVRYSANADGTNFTEEWSSGKSYIGIATGQIAPTDKSGYNWMFIGEGAGGSGLPDVNAEDNGKVLIVNEGDWTVGALPNNLRDTLTITLKASAWADGKQTIVAAEVSENCTLVVNPTEGSKDAYIASVIELTEAEVGKMVFECTEAPTEDIEVLVHVVGSLVEVDGAPDFIFANSKEELPADAKEGAIAFVPSEGESGGNNIEFLDLSGWISVSSALVMGGAFISESWNGNDVMTKLGKGVVKIRIHVSGASGAGGRNELEMVATPQAIYNENRLTHYQVNGFAYDGNVGLVYLYALFTTSELKYMAKVVTTHNAV